MKTIALSSSTQYQKLIESGYSPEDFRIFCDNERLYEFLEKKNIQFEKLDEMLLKNRWEEINNWGIGQAARWIVLGRENRFFKVFDFAAVIFLWFSVLLIMALKNYLYARHILAACPQEVFIFKGKWDDQYPLLAGNASLNYLLEDMARKAGIPVCDLELDQNKEALLHEGMGFKQKIRSWVKKSLEWLYSCWVKPSKTCDVFAFGTLRHLSSTMIELKNRGLKIFFYDDELRINHLFFALSHKISYVLPACFKKNNNTLPENACKSVEELIAALEHPHCAEHFVRDGYDFKNYIKQRIFETMGRYREQLNAEENIYRKIFRELRVGGILVDEDFNAHSFFVEFVRKAGIPDFCISHASLALDSAVAVTDRAFAQSYTFVQSEHERETYLDRGWMSEKIIVTGIPRYDHAVRLMEKIKPHRNSGKLLRILINVAYLRPASPDIPGYLGVDIYAYRYFQEQTVRAFLQAARDLPISFILKPHYADDEIMWRYFLKKEFADTAAEVAPVARDYFELLLACDAMAIGLWSSTIIEAGIAHLPVFYLDLENTNSGQVKRLQESGLCKIIRSTAALRQELELGEKKSKPLK